MPSSFDLHATEYDRWFLANENLLRSELALLARCLGARPGRTLSVGCGSGLFERLLSSEYGIEVTEGLEPSAPMAAIARERGLTVAERTAEAGAESPAAYDTVLFNGTPGYLDDLAAAFAAARRALRPGGRIVVLDVPKESGFGLLYNLAVACGDWDDARVSDVKPPHPYPVAFAAGANWRTTAEKVALLEAAGFTGLEFFQTLTVHPMHTDRAVEDPVPGHDRGGYVGIIGRLAEGSAT